MVNCVYTIDEIKKKLELVLKDTKVKKAILFGSYAKGVANNKSDIEILD